MAVGVNTAKFNISLDGDSTGEKWIGEFTVKTRLSHRDQMRRDQFRRELLGDARPDMASPRALNQASIFSDLQVRIVDAPKWWLEAANGLDLLDDNVVGEVYSKALEEESKVLQAIKKEGEEAVKDLKENKPQS